MFQIPITQILSKGWNTHIIWTLILFSHLSPIFSCSSLKSDLVPKASHNFLHSYWCCILYHILVYKTFSKSFQIQLYIGFLTIRLDLNTELIYWVLTSLYPFFERPWIDMMQCLSILANMAATSITLSTGIISIVQFWPQILMRGVSL